MTENADGLMVDNCRVLCYVTRFTDLQIYSPDKTPPAHLPSTSGLYSPVGVLAPGLGWKLEFILLLLNMLWCCGFCGAVAVAVRIPDQMKSVITSMTSSPAIQSAWTQYQYQCSLLTGV